MNTRGIAICDPGMKAVLRKDSRLTCVANGFKFTEGPAWWPAAGGLIFSDIPADRLHLWTPDGNCRVFRSPSRHANGNTVDLAGNLVTCEHGSRTVTRTAPDGTVKTIASSYRGRKLNSPNDVIVKRDGTVWFTDPPYGIKPEQGELPANYVFRLDPGAAEPVAVASDFSRPNGLCFSPDERVLYIADSDKELHHVRRFAVNADNTLSGGEVFIIIDAGLADGIRVDEDGRFYSTSAEGVVVFDPEGKLLGKLRTPATAANCAFGGKDGRTLFITATDAVWSVRLSVRGASR